MSWLERQSFLGADSERQLRDLTIVIVGLGGGGSHVAQQAAHVGIGGFVLIDDDRIDDTNLNRLTGATTADVERGERKVDIAERLILGINPAARIVKAASLWQDAVDAVRRCDVVFGCVDNVSAKDQLEALCRRLMIPYVDQSMDVHPLGDGFMVAGQVVLSMAGAPCLRCLGVVTDEALNEEGRNYGAAGGKPQVVWPNGLLSSVASTGRRPARRSGNARPSRTGRAAGWRRGPRMRRKPSSLGGLVRMINLILTQTRLEFDSADQDRWDPHRCGDVIQVAGWGCSRATPTDTSPARRSWRTAERWPPCQRLRRRQRRDGRFAARRGRERPFQVGGIRL